MYRIMYLSTATVKFSDEELEELLKVARRNNLKCGVTGLLIIKGRSFLQCLEGKKENVLSIFEKIKDDKRHDSIIRVIEENVEKRYFPSWSMGYKNINHLDSIQSEKLINFSDEKGIKELKSDEIFEFFKEFIELQ